MALPDAVLAARGHVAWILALVISAAIIVWLEATGPAPFSPPVAAEAVPGLWLDHARAGQAANPDDPEAQLRLLLALTLAALEGEAGDAMRQEALSLRAALAGDDSATARAALDLAASVFRW